MRIVYVANHEAGQADDEGAIAHCLRILGHEVTCLGEDRTARTYQTEGDILLFHKWFFPQALRRSQGRIFRCFWYFDLVDYPDKLIERRSSGRKLWMQNILPYIDLGFCSDGDWVERTNKQMPNKLVYLPQGIDPRVECPPRQLWRGSYTAKENIPLLFTGIVKGGRTRQDFVVSVRSRWGDKFTHIQSGEYREQLADLIARTSIVLCPDGPVTDRYTSNRVYWATGLRGFVLHPKCAVVAQQYDGGNEVVFYDNRDHLHQLIERYLRRPEERRRIAENGYARTRREHTYLQRCKQLIETIEERM